MAGTFFHVSGARKLSDDIDDTETIGLAVQADGGHAGASAPTTDPAGAFGGAGAGAPTPADLGIYIPVAEATSAAAGTFDATGAHNAAGVPSPTDPAGAYRGWGARARPLVAASTGIPVSEATPSAPKIVNFAGPHVRPDASEEITDTVGVLAASAALDPNGAAPPGYYYDAGAWAYVEDPAGACSAAGASAPTRDPAGTHSGAAASAPTLGAPSPDISVTEAASPAKKIVSPPGTYLPPGATAPIADPGGTYTSGYDASAPTTDPAGTYSSPYALTRLFIEWQNNTPDNTVLPFNSVTAVENYYGATSSEATLAKDFFAVNYGGTPATMLFTRLGLRRRPHLLGANIGDLTLSQLQGISGSLAITFQGYTYSGTVNLAGVPNFTYAAGDITRALNRNLPVAAVTAESSIASVKVKFTGSTSRAFLTVTSISSGSIEIGALISGPGIELGTQIISQVSGTPGGVGVYNLFAAGGNVSSETITETYGVLTVGAVNSGTVGLGEQVTGAGVLPLTAIDSHLSGSGAGSTWIVNNAQTVAGKNMTMTAPPLSVFLDWNDQPIIGATANNDFFNVSVNGAFGYDLDPSSLSYMSGTAAAALGLTRESGAINSSPGGQSLSVSELMNNLVQNETSQFGSFYSSIPNVDQALAAWAQLNGYQLLSSVSSTPTAGSSLPITDPAGTWSGPGASAPTLAAPGTYIPVTGATSAAAEVTDPAGTYSLAGASTYTYAQPGYYVPLPGMSYETPVSPGFYQPHAGASKELPDLLPTISGTVAGQSTPSGQTDTPFFSATIADTNIGTTDSLSIELTGGGGKLSDGAGFSGLTESAPGVYVLSGTTAAITSELEALVFTPNTFTATTTFTLTDTTSLGTSASNAKTTVTVTNGEPDVVSVSKFLADQSTLDGTPGGFDILDSAGAITANLDQLSDSHIDAIVISNNGNVVSSVQQLTTDATAIGNLENANLAPVLLAINDTATDVQDGLSTLVAHTREIASITESKGSISVSAAAFLADQSTLDKIVRGFDVSDTAANLVADLDQLNDPNISAIIISHNGQITASVAQLTTDATAIGKLQNADLSPVLLAINDTAGAVETGLSTLVQDTAEIASITASNDDLIVVSAATFQADQSTLDKIMGGFDVSDDAADLVADLSTLDANSNVAGITAAIGEATLSGGVRVNAPSFSESGYGTSLTVSEALTYAGAFSQGVGSTLSISSGDTLSLKGTASLSGTTSGAGTLVLGKGSATIDHGAQVSVSHWSISGAGTDPTLDGSLSYAGAFSEGAGDTFVLSGGSLLLSGAATFAGGTVDGSNFLYTEGTTTVSGLTIGGTVEWENINTANESGGSATIGDANGDEAVLYNTPKATYDILDNSGVGQGSSTASHTDNAGLFEKTGGTGTSTITPNVTNTGTIEVAAGRLDFKEGIYGAGADTVSGASTLEFNSIVTAGQTASFTGSGGELALFAPAVFAGSISGFDTAGAGLNDTIQVGAAWVFTGFTENAGGAEGELGFMNGSSTISLTLIGDYTPADFVANAGPHGSTLITYK